VPPIRTTISCRVAAPFVVFGLSVIVTRIAAQAPAPADPTLPAATRWSVVISAPPATVPAIGADHVFTALQTGIVAAHRLADGVEAWRVDLATELPVAIEGDRVFVAAGEAIHALRGSDRTVLWRVPSGALTAPMLVQSGWLIAASAGTLAAYRTSDGTLVWHQDNGEERLPPTIEGDNLYVPLADGRLRALELATGRTRWEQRFDGAPGEVLAFPDRLFLGAGDKYFYSVRADSGELAWRWSVGAAFRGRPAADDSRIYVAAMDNVLRAFDRRTGALVWHPSVPFRPSAGPALVGASVVVPGTASEIRAFNPSNGHPAGRIALGEPLATAPGFGVVDGTPLVAAFTGALSNQWKLTLLGPPAKPATAPPIPLQAFRR
jgi:outer membrane protein assembly factor BamB